MSSASAISYNPPGPVARAFMRSNAFVRGIRGPIGSGKSTACVMEILRRARQQPPGNDGIRRSRWAVIRNSFPELKTTTIKTWHAWVSRDLGRWVDQGPPTHHIIADGIDLEVIFIALDSPRDVRKLLSLELTGAWINEAREVPLAVLEQLTGRVMRYPSAMQGGRGWFGIILDTNSPDDDHWWYRLAEKERPQGYEFYAQPSGLSDEAENLDWLNQNDDSVRLPLGHPERRRLGRTYYETIVAGKSEEWIKVYVHGEYGFVQDGRPVYPEYRDSLHCRAFELPRGTVIDTGLDFGLTPAAVFGARLPMGGWRWRWELCSQHMGAKNFGELVLKPKFAELERLGFVIGDITGDPAGEQSAQTDESTPFKILNGIGIAAKPARFPGQSNDFTIRREAVAGALGRLVDGEPGLLIHPDGCPVTRRGMAGRYAYRRVRVLGDERFHDKPDKNEYSHPCEAGQYLMLGGGEGRRVMSKTVHARADRPRYATT